MAFGKLQPVTFLRTQILAAGNVGAGTKIEEQMNEDERALFRQSVENHIIAHEGTHISEQEAAVLTKEIQENEFNCNARLRLIGYFFGKMMYQSSRQAAVKRQKHILWMIDNFADAEVCSSPILAFPVRYPKLYEEAKEHWVKQLDLDCKNLQLLKNAAAFFSFHELNIAEQLILNAIKLDPNNIYWAERLNEINSLTDNGLHRSVQDRTSRRISSSKSK
jgi:hypothetical protein